MAIDGNAYDRHTLKPQLKLFKELADGKIRKAVLKTDYKINTYFGSGKNPTLTI